MACDICGKKGTELVNLLDSYQTPEVKQVCDDCRVILDKHLSKLKRTTHNILVEWMRRFVASQKERA